MGLRWGSPLAAVTEPTGEIPADPYGRSGEVPVHGVELEAGSGSLGVASSESAAGAVDSGPAALESAAALVVALTCGLCVVGGFGWL